MSITISSSIKVKPRSWLLPNTAFDPVSIPTSVKSLTAWQIRQPCLAVRECGAAVRAAAKHRRWGPRRRVDHLYLDEADIARGGDARDGEHCLVRRVGA